MIYKYIWNAAVVILGHEMQYNQYIAQKLIINYTEHVAIKTNYSLFTGKLGKKSTKELNCLPSLAGGGPSSSWWRFSLSYHVAL